MIWDADNWETFQYFTFTAPQDANAVGEEVEISYTLSERDADDNVVFFAQSGPAVITVIDDEAAARSPGTPAPDLPVFPPNLTFENFPDELTVGQVAQFDFGLSSEPTSDVTVTLTNSDSAVVFTNFTSHTFTTSNWQSKSRVNVLGWASASVGDTATLTFTASGDGYTDSSVEKEITIVVS